MRYTSIAAVRARRRLTRVIFESAREWAPRYNVIMSWMPIALRREGAAMEYRGHVENGVIRLEEPAALPEGALVEVRLLSEDAVRESEREIPSLLERLKDVVGRAEGMPPDASVNLDHYLYGVPKRE